MGDYDIHDEGQRKWDDRVRRDKEVERYNEEVERYNERAAKLGLEKRDKIEYNPLEHAANEATASLYRSTRFNYEEARKLVDCGPSAREIMEKMEQSERDVREEWRARREREARVAPALYFWWIVGVVLGGIIGGICFYLLVHFLVAAYEVSDAKWKFVTIPAIAMVMLYTIVKKCRRYDRDVSCVGGCGLLVGGAVGTILLFWLLSAIPLIASISIGAVIGAVCGVGIAAGICEKVYDI